MSGIIGGAGSKSGVIGTSSGFVEMVDQWRQTIEIATYGDVKILGKDTVLERMDTFGMGDGTNSIIGGGVKMSLNTTYGVWTFPLTGVYNCHCTARAFNATTTPVLNLYTRTYTILNWDGSSGTENIVGYAGGSAISQYSPTMARSDFLFKVENTSTHVVKWDLVTGENAYIEANTNLNYTYFIFTRLANL